MCGHRQLCHVRRRPARRVLASSPPIAQSASNYSLLPYCLIVPPLRFRGPIHSSIAIARERRCFSLPASRIRARFGASLATCCFYVCVLPVVSFPALGDLVIQSCNDAVSSVRIRCEQSRESSRCTARCISSGTMLSVVVISKGCRVVNRARPSAGQLTTLTHLRSSTYPRPAHEGSPHPHSTRRLPLNDTVFTSPHIHDQN